MRESLVSRGSFGKGPNFSGVRHAVPLVETRAYLAGDKEGADSLIILGVDLLSESSVRSYKTTDEEVIDDPLVFFEPTDSIIVTHSFAKSHRLSLTLNSE